MYFHHQLGLGESTLDVASPVSTSTAHLPLDLESSVFEGPADTMEPDEWVSTRSDMAGRGFMGGEKSSGMLCALGIPHKYPTRGKHILREKTIWESSRDLIAQTRL